MRRSIEKRTLIAIGSCHGQRSASRYWGEIKHRRALRQGERSQVRRRVLRQLGGEYGQSLSYRVPEVRAEHAHIVTAAIAHTQDRLFG